MSSSVLTHRQSTFKGAGAEVTITEDGVEYKALELQNLTDGVRYLKRKTDKGASCTVIDALGAMTRVAEDGNGITFGFSNGVGTITINAAIAIADKEFSWLAAVL